MPLSEYEQRVLEEMEQQLRSDDPKLAKAISGGAPRRPMTVALGSVLVLAGVGLLFIGLYNGLIWLGLLAFVAMFAGVLLALRRPRSGGDTAGARADGSGPSNVTPLRRRSGSGAGSFMTRLEQRWDRRRDEGR
jgi:hypothetical protein